MQLLLNPSSTLLSTKAALGFGGILEKHLSPLASKQPFPWCSPESRWKGAEGRSRLQSAGLGKGARLTNSPGTGKQGSRWLQGPGWSPNRAPHPSDLPRQAGRDRLPEIPALGGITRQEQKPEDMGRTDRQQQ